MDSDGVFADFDRHATGFLGCHPSTHGDAHFWRSANANPHFWSSMPVMAGAREFWALLEPHRPLVLTGCPKSGYERAAIDKIAWWKAHFDLDAERVITCLSRNKAMHMRASGDVLVDDMEKNIRRWEAAGGRGVLFRSYAQAAADLAALGLAL